jgi:hypothetical protein
MATSESTRTGASRYVVAFRKRFMSRCGESMLQGARLRIVFAGKATTSAQYLGRPTAYTADHKTPAPDRSPARLTLWRGCDIKKNISNLNTARPAQPQTSNEQLRRPKRASRHSLAHFSQQGAARLSSLVVQIVHKPNRAQTVSDQGRQRSVCVRGHTFGIPRCEVRRPNLAFDAIEIPLA